MRVRNPVAQARLEHAQAPRRANHAVGIGEPDRADALLAPSTKRPRERDDDQRRRESCERVLAIAEKSGVLSRGSDMLGRHVARQPERVLNPLPRALAALVIAQQRQSRQKHRDRKDGLSDAGIKRLQAQPHVDADAAVNPDDEQEDRLQDAGERVANPEFEQHLGVALLGSEQTERDARAEHVVGQEKRDSKAERKLRRFHAGPAEMTPLVEGPEPKGHVDRNCRIENDCARDRLPNPFLDLEPILHRLDRNVAERVIGEMQRHIGKQNEAGHESNLPNARRARGAWLRRSGTG